MIFFIQVTKVERLENPELWREYSQRRERLFRNLEETHRRGSSACCSPVESLPKSRGPVKTTASIAKDGPLCREIYQQVSVGILNLNNNNDSNNNEEL